MRIDQAPRTSELVHWEPETKTKERFERPLVGVSVLRKTEDGFVKTTSTNGNGRHSFSGLLGGHYTVGAPVLPGTYRLGVERGEPIELTNPRACLKIDFQYH
jgi:hypothetical protein